MPYLSDLPEVMQEELLEQYIRNHCATCEHFYPNETICSIGEIVECYDAGINNDLKKIEETKKRLEENKMENTPLGNCPRCGVPLSKIVTGRMPVEMTIEQVEKGEETKFYTWIVCEACVDSIELLLWDKNLTSPVGTKHEIINKKRLIKVRDV